MRGGSCAAGAGGGRWRRRAAKRLHGRGVEDGGERPRTARRGWNVQRRLGCHRRRATGASATVADMPLVALARQLLGSRDAVGQVILDALRCWCGGGVSRRTNEPGRRPGPWVGAPRAPWGRRASSAQGARRVGGWERAPSRRAPGRGRRACRTRRRTASTTNRAEARRPRASARWHTCNRDEPSPPKTRLGCVARIHAIRSGTRASSRHTSARKRAEPQCGGPRRPQPRLGRPHRRHTIVQKGRAGGGSALAMHAPHAGREAAARTLPASTTAFLFASHATAVTRRGWAGRARDLAS